MGFGAASNAIQMNTNNDYISLQSDRLDEDRKLIAHALEVVAESAMKRLPRFRPQELNNLSWGICRLGHHSKAMDLLFHGIGQELRKRHYYFKPQVRGNIISFLSYVVSAVYCLCLPSLTFVYVSISCLWYCFFCRILERHCGVLRQWSILMKKFTRLQLQS